MDVVAEIPDMPTKRPTVLSIGNFDGVHRGHQYLVAEVVRRAHALEGDAVVLSFDPHPRCVVRPDDCPPVLSTVSEKAEQLGALGVDKLVVMPFTTAVSQLSAEEFCDRLWAGFAPRALVVGPDFALGHKRRGDIAFLRGWGADLDVEIVVIEPLSDAGQPVSSSRIRAALLEGDVAEAQRLLGRQYSLDGIVEAGAKVGRTLGFPTANLALPPTKCLPKPGIYAAWAHVESAGETADPHSGWRMAATSIGYRPTFGEHQLTVEAYLLDFDGEIYDRPLRLALLARLRDEKAFPSVDELITEIGHDVATCRAVLGAGEPPLALTPTAGVAE